VDTEKINNHSHENVKIRLKEIIPNTFYIKRAQRTLQQHGHAHATHNLPNDEIEILSSGS
jgi:hypothetical protein